MKHEIIENIISISSDIGIVREVNLMRWDDGEAVYDVRDWSFDHEQHFGGISLTKDEAVWIANALKQDIERR